MTINILSFAPASILLNMQKLKCRMEEKKWEAVSEMQPEFATYVSDFSSFYRVLDVNKYLLRL